MTRDEPDLAADDRAPSSCAADPASPLGDGVLRHVGAPMWPVRVEPQGFEWSASSETDLVRSAQLAGWRLPRSCRNGVCRACRCRLVQGQVQHLVEWPGLSPDELADGWILPCVAAPRSPLVLEAAVTSVALPSGG